MEEIYEMFIPGAINGYLQGFKMIFDSLTAHPLLSTLLFLLVIGNIYVKKMSKHH